jgi:hypothetical protein
MLTLATEAMKLTSLTPRVQLGNGVFACWWAEIEDLAVSLWALVFSCLAPHMRSTSSAPSRPSG